MNPSLNSLHLFNQKKRNFSSEIDECKPDFDTKFNETVEYCRGQFEAKSCLSLLQNVKDLGENCFNKEQRFIVENSEEWNIAGVFTAAHCALPIVLGIVVWLIQSKLRIFEIEKLKKIPFPFVSKLLHFYYTRKLFSVYARRYDTNFPSGLGTQSRELLHGREITKWLDKIRKNEAVVNLSHLIEATAESSFQFWFQTIYLMPTIFIEPLNERSSDRIP